MTVETVNPSRQSTIWLVPKVPGTERGTFCWRWSMNARVSIMTACGSCGCGTLYRLPANVEVHDSEALRVCGRASITTNDRLNLKCCRVMQPPPGAPISSDELTSRKMAEHGPDAVRRASRRREDSGLSPSRLGGGCRRTATHPRFPRSPFEPSRVNFVSSWTTTRKRCFTLPNTSTAAALENVR